MLEFHSYYLSEVPRAVIVKVPQEDAVFDLAGEIKDELLKRFQIDISLDDFRLFKAKTLRVGMETNLTSSDGAVVAKSLCGETAAILVERDRGFDPSTQVDLSYVKYFSLITNTCIIRVARDQHNIAWAGLMMITAIDGKMYIPNIVYIAGTIKYAQLADIAHNREVVARYRALASNPVRVSDKGSNVCAPVGIYVMGSIIRYLSSAFITLRVV